MTLKIIATAAGVLLGIAVARAGFAVARVGLVVLDGIGVIDGEWDE